ncbi:MAG: c-type cytochrome [Gemmatimonadales bacterium]
MRRWLILALMCCGCVADERRGGAPGSDDDVMDAAYTLPPQSPARFGLGTEAGAARIALWDVDVKPDGEGLPAGRGTVAEGEVVFRTYCVACHGATGTEGPNDQLVGTEPWETWPGSSTVGGYWPYATTLYDYIVRAMPQVSPGILTADQTYAVIAYILNRNGIVPADAVMDAETLPAVRMPARDRFVTDDRQGGPEVR